MHRTGPRVKTRRPLLQGAHLAGYNSLQHDVPLLKAEYGRHGLGPLPGPEGRAYLDVMRLPDTYGEAHGRYLW
jgi:DNA polymerase-3 subunit epsilon